MASRRPRDSDANGSASSSTQVDGAGTVPGQPLDEQVRNLVQLAPERADLPRGERAGRDLPALAVRGPDIITIERYTQLVNALSRQSGFRASSCS